MSIERILIVDDEMLIRNFLAETLRRKGFEVVTAENGRSAMERLKEHSFDLVITDMKMPDATGIDILKRVKELSPTTIVVVITAFGSIENAVDAMRLGAFNYLIKPFTPDTIEAVIEKAKEHVGLLAENQYLRQELPFAYSSSSNQKIIANSPVMKKIMASVARAAKSHSSIFISGESGTGKEVIAQAIHSYSERAERSFIRVNCAAVPDTLIESEFFGHEKGAFTGANQKRLGRFELAHGGTLLLDEITEIPLALQPKLLRVIQEQEFERVGGMKTVRVDVRLISTSNRNMKEAVAEKHFREDLYYRLNVLPIHLPPLRERQEDILPLANYFLEKLCAENHKAKGRFSPEAEKKLFAYAWPGNIRELANIVERAVVMSQQSLISDEQIFIEAPSQESQKSLLGGLTLQALEKQLIIETLAANKNDKNRTAEVLGITLAKLRDKLREYQMMSS